MKKFCVFVTVVATWWGACPAAAQEALVMLSENPAARPQPKRLRPARRAATPLAVPLAASPLTLPFVDDFVAVHPWPDTTKWTTNGVYVNDHYALHMPTIGVATFDALDDHGRLYPHLDGVAAPADTLTSLPIDMFNKNDVVLSFFYQPGGLGDLPGLQDKLRLEFYSPGAGSWTEVWSAAVNIDDSTVIESRVADTITRKLNTQFLYTAFEVDDSWYQSAFQFRFINNVSLTVNKDVPGRANNADFWHLDFVYLDSRRDTSDTRLPDVGMVRPQTHVTVGYSSIPAYHLTSSAASAVFPENTTFAIAYRNLGMGTQNVYRRFSIKPIIGASASAKEYFGGSENIFNGELQERTFEFEPYDFSPISLSVPNVEFEISSYLVFDVGTTTLRQTLRRNDTTRYVQGFYDYYAYDDGSAENGYGLYGYGTSSGRVAVQFKSVMADSLRGVYMYFNLAKDSANLHSFEIAVWDDHGGVPGKILQKEKEKYNRPELRDSLNAYVAYKFKNPIPIAENQVFYVGWIQNSEVFLNVGFDANTPNREKNLYALGASGDWYESIYDGSLMIRPIFCPPEKFPDEYVPPVPVPGSAAVPDEYFIYPNPAFDWITIRNVKAEALGVAPPCPLVEIFDMSGRKHRTGYTDGSGMFSLSGLATGMYIVRIIENETVKTSQKIIVN
jgi:hypothetical protein